MSDDAAVSDRLVALLEASTQLRHDLQEDHQRISQVESQLRAIQYPGTTDPRPERDAELHAHAFHSSAPDGSGKVSSSILAATEQWVEASNSANVAWFDELADLFPGLDPSTLLPTWNDSAANTGALMLYRGFRGEQLLDGMLSNLDLPNPPGFEGYTFAETTNQPGWDVILHTETGDIPANVKIAADARGIRTHLTQHPDITTVYASSDAAADAASINGVVVIGRGEGWPVEADVSVVVDIGQTSTEVGSQVTDALASQATTADEIIELLPLAALAFIGARAGYRLLDTDDQAADIRRKVFREAGDVLINSSVGELAAAAVAESVAAPVTIATALGRAALSNVRSGVNISTIAAERRSHFLERLGNRDRANPHAVSTHVEKEK